MTSHVTPSSLRTLCLTTLAMIAFAANSVFARLALSTEAAIDPVSYTVLRLVAAAAALLILLNLRKKKTHDQRLEARQLRKSSFDALSVLSLFGYAAAFSLAYLRLDTAMGALILFGIVQLTMVGWGLFKGEKLTAVQVIGIALASAAFIYLMSPGLSAPDTKGAALMAISGVCWGVYSLAAKGHEDPLLRTTYNFLGTLPLAILAVGLWIVLNGQGLVITQKGLWLAVISGALTSGAGYAIWYSALQGLSSAQGGIVQLSVPVLAAIGGVMLVDEPLTLRLSISGAFILGGIALTMLKRSDGKT